MKTTPIERIVKLRLLRDRLYEYSADFATPAAQARTAYRMGQACVRGIERLRAAGEAA